MNTTCCWIRQVSSDINSSSCNGKPVRIKPRAEKLNTYLQRWVPHQLRQAVIKEQWGWFCLLPNCSAVHHSPKMQDECSPILLHLLEELLRSGSAEQQKAPALSHLSLVMNFLLSCFRGCALASLLSRFLMNQAIHETSEEGGTCTWHCFITLLQNSTGLFSCILLGCQLNCYFKYISSKWVWEILPKKEAHRWNKKILADSIIIKIKDLNKQVTNHIAV